MSVSSSEEMNEVDVERDGLRPSGERPCAPSSTAAPTAPPPAPTVRPPAPKADAFDDVTPTRSLVEVGLADMDEDLPTRMQALDEVARFRIAAADEDPALPPAEPAASARDAAPTVPPRRDVLRPPPASPEPAGDGVSFRSFPAPRGRDSVPVAQAIPAAPALPREADALSALDADLARGSADDGLEDGALAPTRRGRKVVVGISLALLVLAVAALLIERFAR